MLEFISISPYILIACAKQTSSSVIGVTISKREGHTLHLGRLTKAQMINRKTYRKIPLWRSRRREEDNNTKWVWGEKVARKCSWLSCHIVGSSCRLVPVRLWKFGFHKYGDFFSPKRKTVFYCRNDCSVAINRVTVLMSWDGRFRYSTSIQTSRCACNLHHDLHTVIYYSVCRNSLDSTHGRNVTGHMTVSSRQRHAAGVASLDNMKWWTTCRWR